MDILVIDQNALIRRAIRSYLANARYNVRESGDGKAIWDLLLQQQAQIIVTTWPIPGVDGVDLLRRIRAERRSFYPYIILLADRNDDESLIEGMQSGADDYLISPVNLKQLRRRVVLASRIQRLENQIHQLRAERDDLVRRDTLTGVFNRRSIYEHTALELARTKREGKALGIILVAIDGLRHINDCHGYDIGDHVIHQLGDTIIHSIRYGDAIGRWGDAEFAVVLPEANLQSAIVVAERIRARVERLDLVTHDNQPLPITVSAGVASTSTGTLALASELFQCAEHSLQQTRSMELNLVAPRRN